ncbi:MAG: histidinol-phosphate transaminase, partial [Candidatus Margulisiibacteriota bacterium]
MNEVQARKDISEIKDYIPGKTPKEPGTIKLSSNENPFGPSPKALLAISKEVKSLQTYPDQKSIALRQALSKSLGIEADCLLCGNGSDEIMQIIASTYFNPGDEVIISNNSFSIYELVSRLFGAKLVFVSLKENELDLSAIAKAVTEKTKAIFLTAPNNPTGTVFKREAFYALVKKTAGKTLLIVDEAYVDFMEDKAYPDMLDEIKMGRNVIVLRTFSKYYGLAGIRLGYCAAKKEIIAPMYKTKMPFNVNRLAQAAAIAALGDKAFLKNTYRNNLEGKKYLYAELDKLGLEYKKTEANFIFITLKQP